MDLIEDAVKAAGLTEFVRTDRDQLVPWSRIGQRAWYGSSGAVTVTLINYTLTPGTAPYFLEGTGTTSSTVSSGPGYTSGSEVVIDLEFKSSLNKQTDFPYLIVNQLTGEGAQDYDIVSPGIGILTDGNDVKEVVTWSSSLALNIGRIAIRLNGRGLAATPVADPVLHGFTLESGVGATGTVEENILTILESSGSVGVRGTYDSLALGFGLGIPEALIDTDELSEMPFKDVDAPIIQSKRASVAKLLGGWIAAAGRCLVNYRESGTIKIKPVETDVAKFSAKASNCEELTTGDVMLGRLSPAEVVDPANPVVIETGSMLNVGAKVTVRDSVALQECGARQLVLSCPGMSPETARLLGCKFIYTGSGRSAVTIGVGPWVDVQPGDPVILSISHPGLYDWDAGTPAAESVSGRVVGWSRDLVTNEQSLTVLLSGAGGVANLLCPVAVAASESGGTLTLTSGVEWFAEGDSVILYNRGEPTEMETKVIDTISGNDVTFTASLSGFVGANTRMTYPNVSAATILQDDYFFDNTDYRWSG
jgi:hypothetical protein